MLEKIENSLKDLMSSLQLAKIYPAEHPQFKESIDKARADLEDILRDKEELVIGIIGDELAFEKDIFFDLSKKIHSAIVYLKERGIERIVFKRGLKKEELVKFINFLITPKDEIKRDAQEYMNLAGVRNIVVGKIKAQSAAPARNEIEKSVTYLKHYEDSLDKVSGHIETLLSGENFDYLDLRFTVVNVMENLIGRYQEFLKLATFKKRDVGTFIHILNVSVLSMYLAHKMGFSKDDVLDIGVAALFHDIGKIYISRSIIRKTDKLTDDEFTAIKNHAALGAEILLKYVDSLGILPVVIAYEHHLRYDMKGYPKLTFPKEPNIVSLLVSVCDVYDALTQRRSYKRDYPPDMVYNIMIKERKTIFEPQVLDKFFNVIGVWPVGTVVALNDERIAIVREENEGDIFCPKVEVISQDEKKEIIDLKAVKDKIAIARALNPFGEGKEYINLI